MREYLPFYEEGSEVRFLASWHGMLLKSIIELENDRG